MGILELVLTLAVAGFVVFLILQIPMPQIFRTIIVSVVALVAILWVLQAFGLIHSTNFKLR